MHQSKEMYYNKTNTQKTKARFSHLLQHPDCKWRGSILVSDFIICHLLTHWLTSPGPILGCGVAIISISTCHECSKSSVPSISLSSLAEIQCHVTYFAYNLCMTSLWEKGNILIDKWRCELLKFILPLLSSSLRSCISISIYAQQVPQLT